MTEFGSHLRDTSRFGWKDVLLKTIDDASPNATIRVTATRQSGVTTFAKNVLVATRGFVYILPFGKGRTTDNDIMQLVGDALRNGSRPKIVIDMFDLLKPAMQAEINKLRGICTLVLFSSTETMQNVEIRTTTEEEE